MRTAPSAPRDRNKKQNPTRELRSPPWIPGRWFLSFCRAPCLRRFCARTLPLLAGLAFLLYPSAPEVRVAEIRVTPPALDLGLALRLRVRNPGFLLPLRERAVSTAVFDRGHLLGSAKASPGCGLALRLRVCNPGFLLPLRERAVSAAVSYRGHMLGSAKASPGCGLALRLHKRRPDPTTSAGEKYGQLMKWKCSRSARPRRPRILTLEQRHNRSIFLVPWWLYNELPSLLSLAFRRKHCRFCWELTGPKSLNFVRPLRDGISGISCCKSF